MFLPVVVLAAVIALLLYESSAIGRDVNRLRRRVHVGGTRGKSSVTRYIASGLRECGVPAWGKITGIRPTLIMADGSTERIKRRGCTRVQEQFGIIRRAVREGVDSLILECMSIAPELQALESRVFRPHVFVLTRIRDDHREQLGDADDQINAMCSAIPRNAVVITDDQVHREIIGRTATARRSRVVFVESNTDPQSAASAEGFFPVNVALALRTCEELGLDSRTALTGIMKETSVPMDQLVSYDLGNLQVKFVNGFAANDIESSRQVLDYWRARVPEASRLVVILNTRADRPLRSSLFASWLGKMDNLSKVILLGDHAAYTRRALAVAGVAEDRIVVWRREQLADVRASLRELGSGNALVVGVGNIGGDGFRVAESLGVPV